ncbi:hypothetical protein [Parvularcula lutaonensis]|uniref:Uncharacterized protein n=1 Tax=Parvularcula lutaonensis TaxID=491923 RepID=A0ABV7ME90_9PROT|nr:hypothetical protein [Parvularcula lutaonensis]GGY54737.1 hypothetical protein GCM10007148_25570 [Parvularcula lutaonensis]
MIDIALSALSVCLSVILFLIAGIVSYVFYYFFYHALLEIIRYEQSFPATDKHTLKKWRKIRIATRVLVIPVAIISSGVVIHALTISVRIIAAFVRMDFAAEVMKAEYVVSSIALMVGYSAILAFFFTRYDGFATHLSSASRSTEQAASEQRDS